MHTSKGCQRRIKFEDRGKPISTSLITFVNCNCFFLSVVEGSFHLRYSVRLFAFFFDKIVFSVF